VDRVILASGDAMGWPAFWNSPTAAPACIMGNFPYRGYLINLAEKLRKG
jgi:hypothetical protein